VDQKRIPVVVGESLSFLKEGEQELVRDYVAQRQVFLRNVVRGSSCLDFIKGIS